MFWIRLNQKLRDITDDINGSEEERKDRGTRCQETVFVIVNAVKTG